MSNPPVFQSLNLHILVTHDDGAFLLGKEWHITVHLDNFDDLPKKVIIPEVRV